MRTVIGSRPPVHPVLAHSQSGKLATLTIDLETVRRWHKAVDALATTMDDVTSTHLGKIFGVPTPWNSAMGGGAP
jgi:hypothetical protein